MAPAKRSCSYENNSFQSESENESGSDSEGGETSASGSRSSSVESANNQARKTPGSDRSRSPSPADSQGSGSSGSRGRRSRRDSASSGSPQKGEDRSFRSASGSPVDEGRAKSGSRSPSPGEHKSGSASPARGSEDGRSRSESPNEDKSNASDKNSDRSRSPSPDVNEKAKSRSRSIGSNNSPLSSPASRSGSADSDNESRHAKEKSKSPLDKGDVNDNEKQDGSEKAGSKSPSKKSRSQSGSESENDSGNKTRKSISPKAKSVSGSPEKREGSGSPQEKSRSASPQEQASQGSDSDEGELHEGGRKRKRAVLSDDSGSDGEKKKLNTGEGKDDGDESEKDLVIDAEALFGDASDISSDEEAKKKKEGKKGSEDEAERSHGEESDAESQKAKSGDEDNEMEVDEKDEDDKENIPEEPVPETRIDVQIPKITTDLGKEIHFVKLPNFLSVETRPFDPFTYEDEIDEEETLDEEGRARLKLKVENTIRWREITKQNGEFEKQSNARFVKWSDGSLSLHLGSEIFDVCKQPLQGDHNHLFIRQGTGLQGQAVFRTKLTFRPHSTESFTHRKMTLSLADRSQKMARIKVLSLVGKDPEAHRGELIKKEEEKLKASVRRESKQRRIREKGANRGLSAGYLEPDRYGDGDSDDEGISINAIKKQHRNKLSNPKEDRSHIYSSDEDGSDIETRRARRLDKAKALKESDSEGSGGGGGGDKSGGRSSSGED